MKNINKTLIISSLLLSMSTACSNDIENNENEIDTPDAEWINVTMQLGKTAQSSDSKQDQPMTKAHNNEYAWPKSSLLTADEQIPTTYPLNTIYLVKLENGECQATKTAIIDDQLTWQLSKPATGGITIKGLDENQGITVEDGDQVYFASTDNILEAKAENWKILDLEDNVFAPIGDILFISENPLTVDITNNEITFSSSSDKYTLPLSADADKGVMNVVNLERATTLLNLQLAIKSEGGVSQDNANYIKDFLNKQKPDEPNWISDIYSQFRVRFFFAGYPNKYDMTKANPSHGSEGEYTAISYKWIELRDKIRFPLVISDRDFSGFADMSLPYITPHDFEADGSNNITNLYMTFEILDKNDKTKVLHRGTLKTKFDAVNIMHRNTNVVILYALDLSELAELIKKPAPTKSFVTRSAVEDELFGTMIDADVEFEYLTK